MHLRRPLLWLLLLTALFNAAVGAPVHEAWHIAQQGLEAAQGAGIQPLPQAQIQQTQSDDSAPDAESHTRCAWCLTHALEAAAWPAPSAWQGPSASAGPQPPALALTFVPGAGRWRFASRDPPALAG